MIDDNLAKAKLCTVLFVGWKEGNVLFNDELKHILFTVIILICHLTNGKGPLKQWEMNVVTATTWATLSDY